MFDANQFIEEKVAELKKQLLNKTAIIACSGGVDSTTTAVLVATAIGKRLVAVFVDTGFLRKGECEYVKSLLTKLNLNFKFIDASADFLQSLKGVTDPEGKRKIIGEKFGRLFEKVAEEVKADCLIQGTIAPDWIESGGALRDTIKTHHNVGGLPIDLKLEVVEPMRDLYKDEIRKVAKALRLEVADRQPFPGPGLAIRVIGEATPERVEIVREACAIVEEEIEKAVRENRIERPWQYFAVLLPIKSVGVHGDLRAYGYTVAVRIVESIDGMTAAYFKIPYDILERISARITNTIKSVNRVVYDITHKPPSTIEWE